jgi:hemerythrin
MNPMLFQNIPPTGVASIDDQLRTLFELAGRVTDAQFEPLGTDWFRRALDAFADYTQYHFTAEEHFMSRIGFCDFETHRGWHDQFRLEICDLVDAARYAPVTRGIRLQLAYTIETNLVDHILTSDRRLAEHASQSLPPERLRLADSVTLRKAGFLVAEIDEGLRATGSDPPTR